MSSIFTKIRNKEIPAQEILYEDQKVFIFLAKKPHTEGHTLIVPVEEVGRFQDLSQDVFSHMAVVAQEYAKVLERVYQPERVGVAIDGFQVDHTHLHIMPIWEGRGGVWKEGDTPEVSLDELALVSAKIREILPQYLSPNS